jgi:hypothetical protein
MGEVMVKDLDLDSFDKEWERREQFLLDNGWKKVERTIKDSHGNYKGIAWHDPVRNKTYSYSDAYDQLTMIILKEDGWRAILEVKHLGKSKFTKKEEWGRFQSPRTKWIYSFLEAQYIMEQGWKEDIYPEGCSENTRQLNRLAGEDFQGDVIETWHYLENGKSVHKLWSEYSS